MSVQQSDSQILRFPPSRYDPQRTEADSISDPQAVIDTDRIADESPSDARPHDPNAPTALYDPAVVPPPGASHLFEDLNSTFSYAGDPPVPIESANVSFDLGQYRLVEKIGQGGMGSVYRAVHLRLKKQFAVKVLPPSRTTDANAVARFHREMEAVGRLDHENIVRATDAGEVGGIHYLAMELIDGLDLARLLRACGPFPVADACELVRQTAAGLQSAHESKLVHRDIKPSNLLLSSDGRLKILDLGLARLTASEPGANGLTWAGQVMGTPDYMAPEQWDSGSDADIRSDLYSLGCTLYTLLTGRPPFGTDDCTTKTKKMAAHLRDTPQPVSTLCPQVPKGVAAIVDRLLAKEPDGRYDTPAELMAAIGKFAAGADLKALIDRGTRSLQQGAGATLIQDGGSQRVLLTRRVPARLWMACGGLIVLLALAAVIGGQIFPGRATSAATTSVTSEATKSTVASATRVPGVWYDLLDHEPTPLVWPKDENSNWTYDPAKKELFANSSGMALFQLAAIEGDSFELEATIFQNPWSGSFGLYYFGTTDQTGKFSAQTVHVEKFLNEPEAMRTGFINLSWIGVKSPKDYYFNRAVGTKIDQPIAGDVRLKLKVARGTLVAAEWAEAPLQESILNHTMNPKDPTDRSGIGFFTASATTTFRSVRFRTPKL